MGTLVNVLGWTKEEDFLKDVLDDIEVLRGEKGVVKIAIEAWETFIKEPSAPNKEILRVAYENVPEDKRRFLLGDIDAKDYPIRKSSLQRRSRRRLVSFDNS